MPEYVDEPSTAEEFERWANDEIRHLRERLAAAKAREAEEALRADRAEAELSRVRSLVSEGLDIIAPLVLGTGCGVCQHHGWHEPGCPNAREAA